MAGAGDVAAARVKEQDAAGSVPRYLECIRQTLHVALCLQDFPCQEVERHCKPEVEFKTSPELLLDPVLIRLNESEHCLIEGSINSARISIKVKQEDELERALVRGLLGFLCMRAEDFMVLRRKPIPGFDLSFLITSEHCTQLGVERIIGFVTHIVESIDVEIKELKVALKMRDELAASSMLELFT